MGNLSKEQALNVVEQAFKQPNTKCEIVANALPSPFSGRYWTAILISNPTEKYLNEVDGKHEVPQGNHELDNAQNPLVFSLSEVEKQPHSIQTYHRTDKDSLLGFCLHLLLDAVFDLRSYSDFLDDK